MVKSGQKWSGVAIGDLFQEAVSLTGTPHMFVMRSMYCQ